MSSSPVYGAQWAFHTEGGAFGASATRLDFASDTVAINQAILFSQGLRGTRAKQREQSRTGPYAVAGSLGVQPTMQHFAYTLPWAMGGGTTTAPAFADALALRDMLADRVEDVYKFAGLAVNRWRLTGSSGQLMALTIDLVGKSSDVDQSMANVPALVTNISGEPVQTADTTVRLYGSTRLVNELELIIDNNVVPKMRNSLVAQDMVPGPNRGCRFMAKIPAAGDEVDDIYGGAVLDNDCVLTITNATVSAVFTFSGMKITKRTPVAETDEFILTVESDILGTAGGAEATVAIDVTP